MMDSPQKARRRFAVLACGTAALTFALIVFGGVVRIMDAGMGCGDDWPLCHGRLIPPLDLLTLIEYGHRLAAALIGFLVLALALYAIRHRRAPGLSETGAVTWSVISAVLLTAQVLLGAVTVRLELPTSTVVLHLVVGSALLATLLLAALSAMRPHGRAETASDHGRGTPVRWAAAAAALGFVVLVFGGLVANSGAAPACQGFPLCNGRVLPGGGILVHLHWVHRILAFAAVGVVSVAAFATARSNAPRPVMLAAWVALALLLAQIAVAAGLVLQHLPDGLRALHLAVGVAFWAALVVWLALARAARGPVVSAAAAPASTARSSRAGRATGEPARG